MAADEELGALVQPDLHVVRDLLELRRRDLRAERRVDVERMALLDHLDPLEAALHELVVDRRLDERA